MLLVMGLGMQMLAWPDEFCTGLVGRGFTVARFDNRDVGLSTHLREAGSPSLPMILVNPAAVASYRLADMADDAVAVLDALDWRSAHVVGASLGGMIAQTIAIRHPHRVRTLTSMMSTPSPRIGRARIRALLTLAPRRVRDRDGFAQRMVKVFRVIGSPGYPLDEQWARQIGRQSYDRAHDAAGVARQLAAINASGDRRAGLAGVRVPTLVLHGEADPLVGLTGGRATAEAVPGARLVTYPGMGHDLPSELWPAMIDEICALAAERGAPT
ncbi:MAG: alpha/beta fold hydrolase [Pseudonocardiaceae bacterium]|nr:alpha/beta fold hydrolase [Pseudonocardiaceae bacterium]